MDPDACFLQLIAALQDGELETAQDRVEDLHVWLQRGGFPPHGFFIAEAVDSLKDVPRLAPGTAWNNAGAKEMFIRFVCSRHCGILPVSKPAGKVKDAGS